MAFLATIILADHPEWAVTAAFYVALHRVEQLLAASNIHIESHVERLEYVRRHHPAISGPFRQLHDASRLARYYSTGDFFRRFADAGDMQARVIDGWLAAVEAYAAPPPATP